MRRPLLPRLVVDDLFYFFLLLFQYSLSLFLPLRFPLRLSLFYLFPELNYATFYWPLLIGGSALGSVTQFFTTKRV